MILTRIIVWQKITIFWRFFKVFAFSILCISIKWIETLLTFNGGINYWVHVFHYDIKVEIEMFGITQWKTKGGIFLNWIKASRANNPTSIFFGKCPGPILMSCLEYFWEINKSPVPNKGILGGTNVENK